MSNEEINEQDQAEARRILFNIQHPGLSQSSSNNEGEKYWKYNPPSLTGKLMADDFDFLNSLDPTGPLSNPYKKF